MHGNDMARKPFVDTIAREVLGKPKGKTKRLILRVFPTFIGENSAAQ
jgi:hypothetical protein